MFKSIYGEYETQIIEKKSKFIAFTRNIKSESEAKKIILAQKKIHYNARHVVYAYILSGNKKKYSDDGEPPATAGIPILKTLEYDNFFYTIIIVIRYFGGILLGTGGLIHAYSAVSKKVLEKATVLENEFYYRITVCFEYENLSKINHVLIKNNCFSEKIIYDANIKIIFYVKENLCNKILNSLIETTKEKIFLEEKTKVLGTVYNKKFICCGDLQYV